MRALTITDSKSGTRVTTAENFFWKPSGKVRRKFYDEGRELFSEDDKEGVETVNHP